MVVGVVEGVVMDGGEVVDVWAELVAGGFSFALVALDAFVAFCWVQNVATESVPSARALAPPSVVACTSYMSTATVAGAKSNSGSIARVASIIAWFTCSLIGSHVYSCARAIADGEKYFSTQVPWKCRRIGSNPAIVVWVFVASCGIN